MRALVNGKSVNYKGAWQLTHMYTDKKLLILWSMNAFVFLYLKLTRNSQKKELKWNYIYVLFAGREVRIGKNKLCARYSILRAQQPANSVFKSFSYPWYFQVNVTSVLNLCMWVGVCVCVDVARYREN